MTRRLVTLQPVTTAQTVKGPRCARTLDHLPQAGSSSGCRECDRWLVKTQSWFKFLIP